MWACCVCGARYNICSPVRVSCAGTDMIRVEIKKKKLLYSNRPNVFLRLVIYDLMTEFFSYSTTVLSLCVLHTHMSSLRESTIIARLRGSRHKRQIAMHLPQIIR